MPRVLFDISGSPFTKVLSPTTQKLYKGKLNAMAAEDYDTAEKLWSNPGLAVKVIEKLTGDGTTDSDNHKRRQFLCAIFAVLSEEQRKSKSAFYLYYQDCLPNKSGDKDWVKRKDYVSGNESE